MIYITADKMHNIILEIFQKYGVEEDIAADAAKLLVENSLDGIYSHGINRLPRLISYLKKGYVKPNNRPTRINSMGALEKWDGNLGMGNTNAKACMGRAIELAKKNGIGCVALRNTNHWMRGGSYGIQAAINGCIGICWTNTQPNMPPWGAKQRSIGNNPLIFSIPRKAGHGYVMTDAAMAQFSYGAIEAARLAGRQLPVQGGYDQDGNETKDPAAIEETWRVLPIGYWKGSGFSVMMDMIAAALSEGNTVGDIGRLSEDEYALSQIFIAIDLENARPFADEIVESVIRDLKAGEPVNMGGEILYPSEKEQRVRDENLKKGIPVEENVWNVIVEL